MPLDLINGYSRKDSSSASNVYYGYTVNPNPADGDAVFAIRRVNTVAGVETVTWTNGNPLSYSDTWTGRTFSFGAPGGTLGFTYSKSSTVPYYASFTWSSISGVSKYVITATNSNNQILDGFGLTLRSNDAAKPFTANLTNTYVYTQQFVNSGTYSVTLTATNVAGSISSTYVINF